jgi:uroporphyrinogen-III synthase
VGTGESSSQKTPRKAVTKVLLTRAENETTETLLLLQKSGFEGIPCPLFRVVLYPLVTSARNYQALLLTSRNGIRAIAGNSPLDARLIVVGEKTADAAITAGFQKVAWAKGTAFSLVEKVTQTCHPHQGPLLYIRGDRIRHDLKRILEEKGFVVEEQILYRLEETDHLPKVCIQHLKAKELWGALFFSQNAARVFRKHIYLEGLGKELELVYLFGLSKTILKAFYPGDGRFLLAPSSPEIGPLIQLLGDTRNGTKKGST